MKIINSTNFDEITSKGVVLVDFFANWCGPCKMIAPVLEQIAEEYKGKVKIGKVNVDEEMELAQQYKVVSIPMLLVMHNGKIVQKSVGVQPKEDILALIHD